MYDFQSMGLSQELSAVYPLAPESHPSHPHDETNHFSAAGKLSTSGDLVCTWLRHDVFLAHADPRWGHLSCSRLHASNNQSRKPEYCPISAASGPLTHTHSLTHSPPRYRRSGPHPSAWRHERCTPPSSPSYELHMKVTHEQRPPS